MRLVKLLWIVVCFKVSSVFSQKFAGSLVIDKGAQHGFTLFTSLNTKNTYLIDNCGQVLNTWQSDHISGSTSYLMTNGNMVRAVAIPNPAITRGGGGGGIEIMDWESNLLWYFEYNTSVVRQHHDIVPLDNGNILVLAWQVRSLQESLAAGRNPAILEDGKIWSEEIIEVKPVFPNGFEIVWKWNVFDHLVQDYDPSRSNYGVVADHPELIDLNFVSGAGDEDWIHANALDYNPELDQVMVCSLIFNEFWIIDHSTTTAQAASHTGGKAKKGGDLLYRWGNPRTYRKGTEQDRKLGGPHHAHWIKKGLPSAGSVMVFNNRAGTDYSAIEIINPLVDQEGNYQIQDGKFGPATASQTYKASPPSNLRSQAMSGAEMQPNGNLLICSTLQGRLIELTPSLDTVWLYKSPITATGIAGRDFVPTNSNFASDPSFRAIKYPPNYPAFENKILKTGETLEGGAVECDIVTSVRIAADPVVRVYPNPAASYVIVESANPLEELDVRLIDLYGSEVAREHGCGNVRISIAHLPDGVYITRLNNKATKIIKQGRRE
jgi:hypothetical protein